MRLYTMGSDRVAIAMVCGMPDQVAFCSSEWPTMAEALVDLLAQVGDGQRESDKLASGFSEATTKISDELRELVPATINSLRDGRTTLRKERAILRKGRAALRREYHALWKHCKWLEEELEEFDIEIEEGGN